MSLFPEQKRLESFRPFTALGTTAMGERKFGRFITQALDPVVSGRLSRSELWAEEWQWLPVQGAVPRGGLIAVAGDPHHGERWWFVHTDGLYASSDGGRTMARVLDASGRRSGVEALPR